MRSFALKFALLGACLCLLSCIDDREYYHEPVEMIFSPAITPFTRSSSYGLYPEDQYFGVWAYTLPMDKSWNADYSTAEVFIEGEKVSLYENGWRTSESRIWDHQSRTSFFAWSPYDFPASFNMEKGIFFDDFNVVEDQRELMVVHSVLDLDEPKLGGTVALPFVHTLSKVDFNIKTSTDDNFQVYLKSAIVEGLSICGDFQSFPNPQWTLGELKKDFVLCNSSLSLSSETVSLGEVIRIIPQDVKLKVKLIYDISSPEGEVVYSDQLVETNILNVSWEYGVAYSYTIVISPEGPSLIKNVHAISF